MAKYILLSGIHADAKGTFFPGDVVTSEIDLVARHPERFEVLQPGDDGDNPDDFEVVEVDAFGNPVDEVPFPSEEE